MSKKNRPYALSSKRKEVSIVEPPQSEWLFTSEDLIETVLMVGILVITILLVRAALGGG